MARLPVLFIDDGGVLNDNALRGPQWRRLVGEFFMPRLGGTAEAWASANALAVERMFARMEAMRGEFERDFPSTRDHVEGAWLREMCESVGVAAPQGDACVRMAQEANAFINPRVHAAIPGAVETLRVLHGAAYTLHMASGGYSRDLAGCLEGMGVRELFGTTYGSDLAGTLKGSEGYYTRVFADAGVEPRDALVLDDSEANVRLALRAGARAVLVGEAPAASDAGYASIRALTALPALLREIEGA